MMTAVAFPNSFSVKLPWLCAKATNETFFFDVYYLVSYEASVAGLRRDSFMLKPSWMPGTHDSFA